MPAGADAVAPPDAIALRDGSAHALAPLAAGDGVLPAGADMAPGDVLRPAGARLRASDIAACASLGQNRVDVREPRLRIVPARPGPDAVIAAIVSLLAHAVEAAGAIAVTTPPDASGLDGALDADGADAVLVVGGSGSGQRDRSVRTLARRGRVAFHGVGLMPGETAAFGTIEARPVLVVPGRLDAALAVWLTLGARMLARLCGVAPHAQATTVRLTPQDHLDPRLRRAGAGDARTATASSRWRPVICRHTRSRAPMASFLSRPTARAMGRAPRSR